MLVIQLLLGFLAIVTGGLAIIGLVTSARRRPPGDDDAERPFRSGGCLQHDLGPAVVASVEVSEGVRRFFEL